MSKIDFDSGYIHIGQDANVPADIVTDALKAPMESNNIATGTAMIGFDSDGSNYTATFADPVAGSKSISGSCSDLIGNINKDELLADDNEKVGQVSWMGMNQVFDTNAYSAMTGATPKSIDFNDNKNGWTVTNEDGSKNVIEIVADSGSYTKVIGGGDVIERVPLSVRSAPRDDDFGRRGNNYGGSKKGKEKK